MNIMIEKQCANEVSAHTIKYDKTAEPPQGFVILIISTLQSEARSAEGGKVIKGHWAAIELKKELA